jgi:putative ABC transport system permease protein
MSTTYTFFQRYKNNWDLRVTVTDQMKSRNELLKEIRNLDGVKDCVSYQKASAKAYVTAEMLSEDLKSLGGLLQLNEQGITTDHNGAFIPIALLRFDTESFLNYCREIHKDPKLLTEARNPSALAINTIWDNRNSNRRSRKMIPFLNLKQVSSLTLLYDSTFALWEDNQQTKAQTQENRKPAAEVTVSIPTQTDKFPALREEFPDFSLSLVLPDRAADKLEPYFTDSLSYFSIKAVSEERIPDISKNLKNLLGGNYEYILEDRTELEHTNVSIRNAYKFVIGSLAALLVCIGLANVFSNTYGHIYQRRREFARYISMGLSPKGVAKVLAFEALILGFKPVLIGLLMNIPLVYFSLKASLIPPQDFLKQLPLQPVSLFALVILTGIGFAYYTGGRKFYNMDLLDALKQDSLS